jgi:hypothetical protein
VVSGGEKTLPMLTSKRLDQLDDQGLAQLILARAKFHETPEGATLPVPLMNYAAYALV